MHLRVDEGNLIPVRITCFTDADFAGDRKDRKSVSAVVIMVNGATVRWHCKKQSAVAVSTAEAEFVAAAAGGQEVLGLKELFSELGLQVKTPIVLAMDNQVAIKQIKNEASSASAKHVDVKLKFLRDYATKEVVKPSFVKSHDMLADLLTKALPAPRVVELRLKVGLK
ncbi:unnamed protein product [Peronospora effusa]|nr:unnamed protein product [Peronospora effusa]